MVPVLQAPLTTAPVPRTKPPTTDQVATGTRAGAGSRPVSSWFSVRPPATRNQMNAMAWIRCHDRRWTRSSIATTVDGVVDRDDGAGVAALDRHSDQENQAGGDDQCDAHRDHRRLRFIA